MASSAMRPPYIEAGKGTQATHPVSSSSGGVAGRDCCAVSDPLRCALSLLLKIALSWRMAGALPSRLKVVVPGAAPGRGAASRRPCVRRHRQSITDQAPADATAAAVLAVKPCPTPLCLPGAKGLDGPQQPAVSPCDDSEHVGCTAYRSSSDSGTSCTRVPAVQRCAQPQARAADGPATRPVVWHLRRNFVFDASRTAQTPKYRTPNQPRQEPEKAELYFQASIVGSVYFRSSKATRQRSRLHLQFLHVLMPRLLDAPVRQPLRHACGRT